VKITEIDYKKPYTRIRRKAFKPETFVMWVSRSYDPVGFYAYTSDGVSLHERGFIPDANFETDDNDDWEVIC